MSKLKVALLDDNEEQLKLNQHYLENFANIVVITSSTSAKVFLEEVKTSQPDILFLDLNLGDSYMTGMEVAFQLKLPVLFVSSNTGQYIKEIEQLKRNHDLCVDHITKPFTVQEFLKTTNRFLKEIELFKKEEFVYLDFSSSKRNKIPITSIVYLATDKNNGAESNNKQIYFNNRKSENLIDFSFSKMEEKGLLKSNFITIHKSFRVNEKHIKAYHKSKESIEVDILNNQGKLETKFLQVSENYQPQFKKLKK